jgi:hypothetical protein
MRWIVNGPSKRLQILRKKKKKEKRNNFINAKSKQKRKKMLEKPLEKRMDFSLGKNR